MTKEELKVFLTNFGFLCEHDTEYNRDVYTKEDFFVEKRKTKLELYVCYYTMNFQWWYEPNKKVGTSYYLDKILPNFTFEFIKDTIIMLKDKYSIKLL